MLVFRELPRAGMDCMSRLSVNKRPREKSLRRCPESFIAHHLGAPRRGFQSQNTDIIRQFNAEFLLIRSVHVSVAPRPAVFSDPETVKSKVQARTAKIGVIGLGYVGLPLSMLFSEQKFAVTGFDI